MSEWTDAGKSSDIRYFKFNCSLHPLAKMSLPSLCDQVNLIHEHLSIFIGCCFTESGSCTKLNNSELLEQNCMRFRHWQSPSYCIVNTMEPFSVHFTTSPSYKQEIYIVLYEIYCPFKAHISIWHWASAPVKRLIFLPAIVSFPS